jgi:hypothetical protein
MRYNFLRYPTSIRTVGNTVLPQPTKAPFRSIPHSCPQSASFNSNNSSLDTISERGAFNGTQSDQQLPFAETGPVRAAEDQACVSVSPYTKLANGGLHQTRDETEASIPEQGRCPYSKKSVRAGRLTCPFVKDIRRTTRSATTVRVRSQARAHRETWSH